MLSALSLQTAQALRWQQLYWDTSSPQRCLSMKVLCATGGSPYLLMLNSVVSLPCTSQRSAVKRDGQCCPCFLVDWAFIGHLNKNVVLWRMSLFIVTSRGSVSGFWFFFLLSISEHPLTVDELKKKKKEMWWNTRGALRLIWPSITQWAAAPHVSQPLRASFFLLLQHVALLIPAGLAEGDTFPDPHNALGH